MTYFSVSCFELAGHITRNVIYGDDSKADNDDFIIIIIIIIIGGAVLSP
jgi:hypothetical protein